ncbi:MAG: hypothetical protein ACJ8IR_06630 [Alphaproteobacteria bacterium]|jgi:hypothetical protein
MELLRFYWDVVKLALRHSLDQTQYILIVILLLVGAGGYFVPKLANWETIVTGSQAALTVLGSIVAARLLLAPYWLYKEKVEALNSAISAPKHSDQMLALKQREVAALEIQNAIRTAEIQQRDEDRTRVAQSVAAQVSNSAFRTYKKRE